MRVKRRVSYDMHPIQLVDSCNMGSKLSQSHSDLKPVSNIVRLLTLRSLVTNQNEAISIASVTFFLNIIPLFPCKYTFLYTHVWRIKQLFHLPTAYVG
jgi:hypothetical protein